MADYKIWMSYDIGEGHIDAAYDDEYIGRYKPLRDWLREHKAVECGNSVAFFDYTKIDANCSIDECIKKELNKIGIKEEANVRIYIVVYNESISPDDSNENINQIDFAGFIIGHRKKAAWEEQAQTRYSDIDIRKI